MLTRPGELQTAFALEAVVDEVVFMTGPTLATVLATTWRPGRRAGRGDRLPDWSAPLPSARSAAPSHRRTRSADADGVTAAMPWRAVVPLAVVCFALGVAVRRRRGRHRRLRREQGAKSYAGVLLALWALGSLLAGLVTGTIAWRRGPTVRVRLGAVVLALVMAAAAVHRLDGR